MMQIEPQLKSLRLNGMSSAWQALMESGRLNELSFGEGMKILLEAEKQQREQNRFERLQRNARFRYQAALQEVSTDQARGLGKDLLASLATGNYLQKGQSILVTGPTGCGKSFLASALGHQACLQGYKVAYYNMQKLLKKIKIARLEGTAFKFFETTAKTDLLILDDFGMARLEQKQQIDFMEIIEDRHARKSTIIVSQLPVASWFDIIGEATIADAILDRLVHTSHRIELKGDSLRKIK